LIIYQPSTINNQLSPAYAGFGGCLYRIKLPFIG